jgi:bifunctional non-homologous end joining protein LigD
MTIFPHHTRLILITPIKLAKQTAALLSKGKPSPIPQNIEPMLATLVNDPVEDKGWVYEMKWDGYRALSYLNDSEVNIFSRNNKSFNLKFYPLFNALKQWKINAVVDGEIVVVNDQGVPDFEKLQLWRSEADGHLHYYIFDLIWLNGISVTNLPLEERRQLLKAILPSDIPHIRISEVLTMSGQEAFKQAESLHLEGIMAKRAGSPYTIGRRTKDWLKIKTAKQQELIIGGYTLNEGTSKLFSALLLGIIDSGDFRFITPVGTGFNKIMQEEILKKLKPFIIPHCPFSTIPDCLHQISPIRWHRRLILPSTML